MTREPLRFDSHDESSRAAVAALGVELKKNRSRLVFTNGCFDLIHAGHVKLFRAAREAGDVLIVGLNTDESVRRLKGPSRPRVSELDRAEVVAAIRHVDEVILFEDDTPLGLILALKPDLLVKGADYKEEEIVGAKEVKSWGGSVLRVELLEGRSTTALLAAGRA